MENLKSVVDALVAVYTAYSAATVNGAKLSFMSLFQLGPVFMKLPDAINDFNDAVKEAEALNETTAAELEAYIVSQLPADSGNVAQYLQKSVDAVLKGVVVVQDVIAIVNLVKGVTKAAAADVAAKLEAPKQEAPKQEAVQSVGH